MHPEPPRRAACGRGCRRVHPATTATSAAPIASGIVQSSSRARGPTHHQLSNMHPTPLKIVFHGQNAANFRPGFEQRIDPRHQIVDLSDAIDQAGEREHFESADVVIGIKLDDSMPMALKARLFHALNAPRTVRIGLTARF